MIHSPNMQFWKQEKLSSTHSFGFPCGAFEEKMVLFSIGKAAWWPGPPASLDDRLCPAVTVSSPSATVPLVWEDLSYFLNE